MSVLQMEVDWGEKTALMLDSDRRASPIPKTVTIAIAVVPTSDKMFTQFFSNSDF